MVGEYDCARGGDMGFEHGTVDITIIVAAYFHEAYISQALDSILAQETSVRYEVLVGDDASQDRTPKIIQDYTDRFPEVIKPILRTGNVGASRNFYDMFSHAKGNYIAILEGDDYWSDPRKLQKQWEFLQGHPEYVGCCGKCQVVDEHGRPDYTKVLQFVSNKKHYTLDDYFETWNLPGQAGTLMCRNIFRDMDPSEYSILYQAHPNVADKTWTLLFLMKGPIYCSNEILSCYRFVNTEGEHNWFSNHYANPYRDYDMFMYPSRLESWAKKRLGQGRYRHKHLGPRKEYRFCRYVKNMTAEPSLKKIRCLADMVIHGHQPVKYSWDIIKTLIEME